MAKPGGGSFPVLQDFTVQKVLGSGSYGKVYKVKRGADDQSYALKEVSLARMDKVDQQAAVEEIRLLCSIQHPNVVRYHQALLQGSNLYVVMELAPFGDLKYYIDKAERMKSPFPEDCVWRIFLQLAQGLAAIHARQIVHRDIKPANVFMSANDLLKIGDLGVAKALTSLKFARTQIGTPLYMAPEVWTCKPYSFASDMWSLGCVLYEMMTLRSPFRDVRSQDELVSRIRLAKYTPIAAGTYSPELIAFAHSLLTVDPRRRPTAEQILQSPQAAKWMKVLPTPAGAARRQSENGAPRNLLIDTIRVPRDIRQLQKVLPPANYDDMPAAPAPSATPPVRPQVQIPEANGALPPRAGYPAGKPPSPRVPASPSGGFGARSPSPVPGAAAPYGGYNAPGVGAKQAAGAAGGAALLNNRPPMHGFGVPAGRLSDNGGIPAPPQRNSNNGGVVLPPLPGSRPSSQNGAPPGPSRGQAAMMMQQQPMVRAPQRRSTYS